MNAIAAYPAGGAARDRFVLERRGPRAALDPWAPAPVVIDPEPDGCGGGVVDVATLFLTGRECPWRCVMCDLWRHTTEADTPAGAIPHQIEGALARLGLADGEARGDTGTRAARHRHAGTARHIKLYNAGSFFDPRAVPERDDRAIARALSGFARVIVESHPALVGARTWRFRDLLAEGAGASGPSLEVAMGLETAHPEALERLHKGFTLERFATAASTLAAHGVGLRAFLLVHPPFIAHEARALWLARSVDVALDCGATAIALVPTRGGNGAMAALAALGEFAPPALADLEAAAAMALSRARGRMRVLADLWDLEAVAACAACRAPRQARLHQLNVTQRVPAPLSCAACGSTTPA